MTKRVLLATLLGLLLAGTAKAEMVVEWWGKTARCRHQLMTIELSKYGKQGMINPKMGKKAIEGIHALSFDLSPIKKGTKVYHASLRLQGPLEPIRTDRRVYMDIGKGVWYFDPLRLYAEIPPWKPIEIYVAKPGSEEGKPVFDKDQPLKLEGPMYHSLDATAAVQDWVNGAAENLGFVVRQLDMWDWEPNPTVLEIRCEGKPTDLPPQASDVKVVHRTGQSHITWTELDKLIDKEEIPWVEFEAVFKKNSPRGDTFYRVYRHTKPITAGNLHEAELVNEMWPLSGYDTRMHQHVTAGEEWMGLDPKLVVNRHYVKAPPEGRLTPNFMGRRREWVNEQLPPHTGLYVHQAPKAGKFYYAVTALVKGIENTHDISPANSPAQGVDEVVDAGEPLLYRVQDCSFGDARNKTPVECQFFMYWAAPPFSNLPRHANHLLLTLFKTPPQKVNVVYEGDGMYGSILVSGPDMVHYRGADMFFTIVSDAAFATDAYNSTWNTLIGSEQGKRTAYAKLIVDQYMPWAKQLQLRMVPSAGAATDGHTGAPAVTSAPKRAATASAPTAKVPAAPVQP